MAKLELQLQHTSFVDALLNQPSASFLVPVAHKMITDMYSSEAFEYLGSFFSHLNHLTELCWCCLQNPSTFLSSILESCLQFTSPAEAIA